MQNHVDIALRKTMRKDFLIIMGLLAFIEVFMYFFLVNEFFMLEGKSPLRLFYALLFSCLFVFVWIANAFDHSKPLQFVFSLFLLCVLVGSTVYLGIATRPFRPENLKGRLGLKAFLDPSIPTPSDLGIVFKGPLSAQRSWVAQCPDILDQKLCGVCWAVATAFAANARYNIKHSPEIKNTGDSSCANTKTNLGSWRFSPQAIVDLQRDQFVCERGNTLFSGYASILDMGGGISAGCRPFFFTMYPNCSTVCKAGAVSACMITSSSEPVRCEFDASVAAATTSISASRSKIVVMRTVQQMMEQVDQFGPITTAICAYQNDSLNESAGWMRYANQTNILKQDDVQFFGVQFNFASSTHVSKPENETPRTYRNTADHLSHAIVIVGYGTTPDGTDYWEIANSWGKEWGDLGYSRIQRGINAWGIELQPVAIVLEDSV
jgi:hypothetical protein